MLRTTLSRLGITAVILAAFCQVSPAQAISPAAIGQGATLPFVTQQAENAVSNGTVIGPGRTFNTYESEASGRKAVRLQGQGKYAEFTLSQPANSLVLRYSIPDSPAGTGTDASLSLYINGTQNRDLALTSRYSYYYGGYPFTNNPSAGNPHHFYDDVRALLPDMGVGTKVRLQVDSTDTAAWYILDQADFEQVAPAATQPANSLSVTSFGADPSGGTDSSNSFDQAIAAARGQGQTVWVPAGTFTVNRHITVDQVTIRGAGPWYSVLHGTRVGIFGLGEPNSCGQGGNSGVSRAVKLYDFAIFGEVQERNDCDQVNGIGGALGGGSVIQNLWIEHTKVGMWFDGPFDGLTITGCRLRNLTADGLNFRKGITHAIVEQTHVRNSGDDGLAMWSEQQADANNEFRFNTVEIPVLANAIAIYGGHDISVTDNLVSDTQTQGGGLHVGNRFGAVPVAGTITLARNKTVRAGVLDPNWQFGVGAVWFYALDSGMNATINVTDTVIQDSSYEAIHFIGSTVTGVNFNNVTIDGTGTFAIQLQSNGSATFTNVTARRLGNKSVYTCMGQGAFTMNASGQSGWSPADTYCGPWPDPVTPSDPGLDVSPSGLDFGTVNVGTSSPAKPVTVHNGSSATASIQSVAASGDYTQTNTCGSSLGSGASCTVNVTFRPTGTGVRTGAVTINSSAPGSPVSVGLGGTGFDPNALTLSPTSLGFGELFTGETSTAKALTLTNPGSSAAAIQSVAVSGDYRQTNNCGTSLAAHASCAVNVTFAPTGTGTRNGTATINAPINAPGGPFTATLTGTGLDPNANLVLGHTVTASSALGGFPVSNANDGNQASYWESTNNVFPQTLTADLGANRNIRRVVLKLPTGWERRTQTLAVLGSTDGSNFTTLSASAGRVFDPASGNTVTIMFTATSVRYVRLNITANTGWPAGQAAEFEAYLN
jgi:hypothetical protein